MQAYTGSLPASGCGGGYRMTFDGFLKSMEDRRNFCSLVHRSVAAFMCDDRIPRGEIRLTHDYIALMLAVRRSSVTTALHGMAASSPTALGRFTSR